MQIKNSIPPLKGPNTDEKNEKTANNSDVEYEQGYHPNSIKALKKHQYKPGQTGNIMGMKPRFESLGKALKKIGEQETLNWKKESQGTRKSQVLDRIWLDAIRGDMKKIQLLAWLGCLD